MDASENTIKPAQNGPERSVAPTVFAGTVTGVEKEGAVQTLEIQYSQGKIRFQAEGNFQMGERVKLSFPGNGSVQVEKGALPSAPGVGVGYTLPQNMTALKDLRAFEENLIKWMLGKQPGGVPLTSQEKEILSRLSMPQLLLKAMDKAGGKEFLTQSLPILHRGVLSALLDALEATLGDPGSKSACKKAPAPIDPRPEAPVAEAPTTPA